MKKTLAMLAAALMLTGYSLNAAPRLDLFELDITGPVPGEFFDYPGDVLVMYFRGMPGRVYTLQGTRDFVNFEDIKVFTTKNAGGETELWVPLEFQYRFFRVQIERKSEVRRTESPKQKVQPPVRGQNRSIKRK